jgi:hypothetical protein
MTRRRRLAWLGLALEAVLIAAVVTAIFASILR